MSTRHSNPSPATAEEPTPPPTSAVVEAGSPDELPQDLRNDPFVQYMMDPPAEDMANLDALLEAGELYGQDHARALADLLAGRHPLQRSKSASR